MRSQTWLLFNKQYIDILNFQANDTQGGLIYMRKPRQTTMMRRAGNK